MSILKKIFRIQFFKYVSMLVFCIQAIFLLNFKILSAGVQTNHIVISELSYTGNAGIIELYNPTSSAINLDSDGYRLERDSNGGGDDPSILARINGTDGDGYVRTSFVIPSHGFYLIVDNGNTGYTNIADFVITRSSTSLNDDDVIYLGTGSISGPTDPDIIDFIGFGNPGGTYEGSGPAPNAVWPGSIERKAWAGATSASMTNGADTNHGNAFDSDDNASDFISRNNADWQNTSSPTEDPYFPSFETLDFSLNGNVPEYVASANEQNIEVMAFNLTCNSNGRTITFIKVSNVSTMVYPSDYSAVKLYYDNDSSYDYSAGDTLACELVNAGNNVWTNSISSSEVLDTPNGKNFIVTIDISVSPNKSKSFKARIDEGWIKISSGLSNLSAAENGTLQFTPLSYKVVVNEIAWSGTTANYSDEWLELYNNTSYTQDLTGWKIIAGDGTPDIALNGTIEPHGFYLAEKSDDTSVSNIPADCSDFSWGTGWNDGGEKVILKDDTGTIIDIVDCSSGWFAGDKTGKKSMERITPSYPGTNGNWATWLGPRQNGIDAAGNNINGTARTTNSVYVPPPDVFTLTKTADIPATNIYRDSQQITIYSFKAEDSYEHNYKINQFINTSTITKDEATNISIYKDSNANHKYDAGETFVERLSWNASGYWEGTNGYDLQPETNYVITMSPGTNVIFGHSFKGEIQLATCSGGKTSSASANANEQIIVSRPPKVRWISLGNISVTNNNQDFLDIDEVAVSNRGDGIGNVVAVISNKYSYYTNFSIAQASVDTWTNHQVLIPPSVAPTNSFLIVRAYDSQNYDFLSLQSEFTVIGNWPPIIESFTVSPSSVYATGLSSISTITLNLVVKDKDGTIASANVDLSSIGGSSSVAMNNISGNTQWQYIYTIPTGLSSGDKTLRVVVLDNDGTTNASQNQDVVLTILVHTIPTANTGSDRTVNGDDVVTVSGSATAYDGAAISGYQWTVISNNTGSAISLTGDTSKTVSFTAPNINSKIVLSFVVTDSWGYSSNPDTITIHINKSFRADLSEAHPYNTVIKPDKNSVRFVNLSQGTVITIYTITGNKVATLNATEDEVEWQIPDYLAGGVYIVYMKDDAGNTKKMKIIVVR